MIINTAGDYTLQYTATDACGNTTVVERELTVTSPPRTVLYTDGTFIINELAEDMASNAAAHGAATNVYIPYDPNGATDVEKYIFSSASERPWHSKRASVRRIEIGSSIQPTSTAYWFRNFPFTSMDLENLDMSQVVNAKAMFAYCQSITSLDVSNFDTNNVTNMEQMFYYCSILETIYASNTFVTTQVTASTEMFLNSSNIIGGAGTVWDWQYTDKERAKIDGGVSDPGYFTART